MTPALSPSAMFSHLVKSSSANAANKAGNSERLKVIRYEQGPRVLRSASRCAATSLGTVRIERHRDGRIGYQADNSCRCPARKAIECHGPAVPIRLPKGKTLATLKEAAAYMLALPTKPGMAGGAEAVMIVLDWPVRSEFDAGTSLDGWY